MILPLKSCIILAMQIQWCILIPLLIWTFPALHVTYISINQKGNPAQGFCIILCLLLLLFILQIRITMS